MVSVNNRSEYSQVDGAPMELSSVPANPVGQADAPPKLRGRTDSIASLVPGAVRRLSKGFEESQHPGGFMAATGEFASSLVTSRDVSRRASERRGHRPTLPPIVTSQGLATSTSSAIATATTTTTTTTTTAPEESGGRIKVPACAEGSGGGGDGAAEPECPQRRDDGEESPASKLAFSYNEEPISVPLKEGKQRTYTAPFDNGYHFPPRYKWQEATAQGLVAFWDYFTTPLGFCVVIYGLNVVAWGGMLFLLLCNAAPAMCQPTCNDINSPRRKWIEWDSQILNALFCVTGFGLAPWRARDWYFLFQYRIMKKEQGLRRLAGFHRGWFRLQGSQDLPLEAGPQNIPQDAPPGSIPYPESKIPDPPLAGARAPPTAAWKMDFVVWSMIGNTALQAVLSGFMWGMDRHSRPSWSTGLFVSMGCIVAAAGGLMMFVEGKRVKSIEGVPLTQRDLERLARDRELGIPHYNNIKDKVPKAQPGAGSGYKRVATG